jgi:hypothetical protein
MIVCLYRLSSTKDFRYFEQRLTLHVNNDEHDMRRTFVYQYLQADGIFMLRLLMSNVNDYVTMKVLFELYRNFRQTILNENNERKCVFQPIRVSQSNGHIDNDSDDGTTTDQTMTADLPPIPNPRQGTSMQPTATFACSSSDSSSVDVLVPQRMVSFSLPVKVHRLAITRQDSHISSPNDDESLHDEPDSPLATSNSKGPSPYATTYLVSNKITEQEMIYIDESVSSGSTSVKTLKQPISSVRRANSIFHRTHDV